MTRPVASPSADTAADSQARAALGAGILCYVLWGFFPLLFQQMAHLGADPWEIMANRMVWGLAGAGVLVAITRQGRSALAVLSSPRTLGWLAASATLIALNWSVYIVSVNTGRTLDASLGYYLNPLLNMAAGAWLFRERVDRLGLIAIALAGVGVLLQALALGHVPWISLLLALSFCGYGVIRKRVQVEAGVGLLVECLLLAVPGLIWLVWIQVNGTGHLFDSPASTLWLVAAGPATVIPLALFAWAARRMPLSGMGFIQFLAPTIVFAIGVAQGETLGPLRTISFVFIWGGAVVFALGILRNVQRNRRSAEAVLAPEPGLIDDPAEDRTRG